MTLSTSTTVCCILDNIIYRISFYFIFLRILPCFTYPVRLSKWGQGESSDNHTELLMVKHPFQTLTRFHAESSYIHLVLYFFSNWHYCSVDWGPFFSSPSLAMEWTTVPSFSPCCSFLFFWSIFYWLCYYSVLNFPPFIPPPPCTPQPSSIPPLVHVHGLYI